MGQRRRAVRPALAAVVFALLMIATVAGWAPLDAVDAVISD